METLRKNAITIILLLISYTAFSQSVDALLLGKVMKRKMQKIMRMQLANLKRVTILEIMF
jgi:hypothetical protein